MTKAVWLCALAALAGVGVARSVQAYEFRCRFVERVGNADVVLPGNTTYARVGIPRNIRLQFGVFDDAAGPALAGGFVGWNVGSISVSGTPENSDERRNPGRLAPFNFSQHPNANGNPPLPEGDPFELLTEIDCTLGVQTRPWVCDGQGNVPPQPVAPIRGLNTFVSVFAFSITGRPATVAYTVNIAGNAIAAEAWLPVGTPMPPTCGNPADPSDDVPGSVTYAPVTPPPRAISCQLIVTQDPAPGSASLFALGGIGVLVQGRRRVVERACNARRGVL